MLRPIDRRERDPLKNARGRHPGDEPGRSRLNPSGLEGILSFESSISGKPSRSRTGMRSI